MLEPEQPELLHTAVAWLPMPELVKDDLYPSFIVVMVRQSVEEIVIESLIQELASSPYWHFGVTCAIELEQVAFTSSTG